MKRSALLAVVASVALAACNPPPAAKTVDYYSTHTVERDARMVTCKNNPGDLKDDADCINAVTSLRSGWKRDLPPITFAAPASAASR